MLLISALEQEQNIVVTLTEKVTITNPFYLFSFIHTETRQNVSFVLSYESDQSGYKDRFNHFVIDAAEVFEGKAQGEWVYKIYEQESSTNTNVSSTGSLLETGKMQLTGNRAVVFTENQSTTTFKTYDGQ